MNKLFFVVFFLLSNTVCFASNLVTELQEIESAWALAYYSYPESKQSASFRQLLPRISTLIEQHPDRAEPKILKAMIVATNAGLENGFSALYSIHQAKDLLVSAIELNPEAFQGSALVNLGTLYYKVPGWPIAFGDDKKAEQLLLRALTINPGGIDSNYFYGDFLLSQNEFSAAKKYFKKAASAAIRPEQAFADNKLRDEAKNALKKIHSNKINNAKNNFSHALFM